MKILPFFPANQNKKNKKEPNLSKKLYIYGINILLQII